MGVPAAMNAAASLGFPRVEYQLAFRALELRDGKKDILIFMESTSPRGSEAARDNPTQRSEVELCVRRTRVTKSHFALRVRSKRKVQLRNQISIRRALPTGVWAGGRNCGGVWGGGLHAIWRAALIKTRTA